MYKSTKRKIIIARVLMNNLNVRKIFEKHFANEIFDIIIWSNDIGH